MKKPSPMIDMSITLRLDWIAPWVNCCLIDLSAVPLPATRPALWSAELEMMSPNSARERLKPMVPTLALLLDAVERLVCAALRQVSAAYMALVQATWDLLGPRLAEQKP